MIGAVIVTVPGCYYILSIPSGGSDEHHVPGAPNESAKEGAKVPHEQEDEDESSEGQDTEGASEDESGDEGTGKKSQGSAGEEDKNESQDQGGEDDETSGSDDNLKVSDTPESGGDVEGVGFKGPSQKVSDNKSAADTRKSFPDAKGGRKKRIESSMGTPVGAYTKEREGEEGSGKDQVSIQRKELVIVETDVAVLKAVSSKEPMDSNQMSGKQEGLSNTDTKHSTPLEMNPEKSKKGEGSVETAKLKGTVKTDRPPV